MARSVALLFLALPCACGRIGFDESHTVVVDLKTDLVPVAEFDGVDVTLDSDAAPRHAAIANGPYIDGVRIAEFDGVDEGTRLVTVTMWKGAEAVVVRRVRADVSSSLGITVIITRDCRSVSCPVPGGDPTEGACLSGRCVSEACLPEQPDSCPSPVCNDDAECVPVAACAAGRCESGACLFADDGSCSAGQYCDPDVDCRPRPSIDAGLADAGTDAAPPDAGPDPIVLPTGPFEPPVLLSGVSSTEYEDDPSLTGDLLEIYFARGPAPASEQNIFRATRPSTSVPFDPPMQVDELSSPTGEGDGGVKVSDDGLTVYFGSRRPPTTGSNEVYVATRARRTDPWGPPRVIAELSSPLGESAFDIGGYGLHGIMSRFDPSLDVNSLDLYLTDRPSLSAPWTTPRPILELNTMVADGAGDMSVDGLVIYFYSSAHGSTNLDLYRATRPSVSAPFGAPEAVTELNSPGRDEDPWVSRDGTTIAFSRDGDIYMATRPPP